MVKFDTYVEAYGKVHVYVGDSDEIEAQEKALIKKGYCTFSGNVKYGGDNKLGLIIYGYRFYAIMEECINE